MYIVNSNKDLFQIYLLSLKSVNNYKLGQERQIQSNRLKLNSKILVSTNINAHFIESIALSALGHSIEL